MNVSYEYVSTVKYILVHNGFGYKCYRLIAASGPLLRHYRRTNNSVQSCRWRHFLCKLSTAVAKGWVFFCKIRENMFSFVRNT